MTRSSSLKSLLLAITLGVLGAPAAAQDAARPAREASDPEAADQGETEADATTDEDADADTAESEATTDEDADANEGVDAEADADETTETDGGTDDGASDEPPVVHTDDALFQTGSGSPESTAAGTVTILAGVATVATLAYTLERNNTIDVCDAYEMELVPTRGCVSTDAVHGQRDLGIGLVVGAGTTLIGAAITWIVVVATRSDPPSEARAGCLPDGAGVRCRF